MIFHDKRIITVLQNMFFWIFMKNMADRVLLTIKVEYKYDIFASFGTMGMSISALLHKILTTCALFKILQIIC